MAKISRRWLDNELQSSLTGMQRDIIGLSGSVNTIQAGLTAARNDILGLTGRTAILETAVAGLTGAVARLTTDVAGLTGRAAKNEQDLIGVSGAIVSLSTVLYNLNASDIDFQPITGLNAADVQQAIELILSQGVPSTGGSGSTGGGITGSQGSTGIAGPTGPIGAVTGTVGATGAQGFTGLRGFTGLGATGLQGPQGALGPYGYTGAKGDLGVTGLAGRDGFTGMIGPIGATGLRGVTGPFGGPQGETGLAGAIGLTGAFGGPPGVTGLIGATGVPGYTGIQGVTGTILNVGSFQVASVYGISGRTNSTSYLGITGLGTSVTLTAPAQLLTLSSLRVRRTSGFGSHVAYFLLNSAGSTAPESQIFFSGTDIYNQLITLQTVTPTLTAGTYASQAFWRISDQFQSTELLDSNISTIVLNAPLGATGLPGATGQIGVTGLGMPGPTGAYGGPPGPQGSTGIQGAGGNVGPAGPIGETGLRGATGPGLASFSSFQKILPLENWRITYAVNQNYVGIPVIEFQATDNKIETTLPVPLEWDGSQDMAFRMGIVIGTAQTAGDWLRYRVSYTAFNAGDNVNSLPSLSTYTVQTQLTATSKNIYSYMIFDFVLSAGVLYGKDTMYLRVETITDDVIKSGVAFTVLNHSVVVGAGSTGFAGPTGFQGVTGIQGVTGTQGVTGIQGVTGVQGVTGLQGITGITGIRGVTGTQGVTGVQGITGLQGVTGITGIRGITGLQGITGIQGVTGVQGTTGSQGVTGVNGITGVQGIQGLTGIQGTTGSQGVTGVNGITGVQGIQGFTGPSALHYIGDTGYHIGISGLLTLNMLAAFDAYGLPVVNSGIQISNTGYTGAPSLNLPITIGTPTGLVNGDIWLQKGLTGTSGPGITGLYIRSYNEGIIYNFGQSEFSREITLIAPDGIFGLTACNTIMWKAPYACTVTNVGGYRVGGSEATINARRNGTDKHLASDLLLSSADTWVDGGAVQNTSYLPGDKLEAMVISASVTGIVSQIAVQVDFTKP